MHAIELLSNQVFMYLEVERNNKIVTFTLCKIHHILGLDEINRKKKSQRLKRRYFLTIHENNC